MQAGAGRRSFILFSIKDLIYFMLLSFIVLIRKNIITWNYKMSVGVYIRLSRVGCISPVHPQLEDRD